MTAHRPSATSPLSFRVSVVHLPRKGMPVSIDPGAEEKARLAHDHELIAVDEFHAELLVEPWKRNGVRVSGRVKAAITQECVVTLAPLHAAIEEPVEALFLPVDSKLGREGFGEGGEIVLDVDGPDSPETFEGDTVDVGALTEQIFALAIDPYPRAGGAELPEAESRPIGEVAEWQQKLREITQKR